MRSRQQPVLTDVGMGEVGPLERGCQGLAPEDPRVPSLRQSCPRGCSRPRAPPKPSVPWPPCWGRAPLLRVAQMTSCVCEHFCNDHYCLCSFLTTFCWGIFVQNKIFTPRCCLDAFLLLSFCFPELSSSRGWRDAGVLPPLASSPRRHPVPARAPSRSALGLTGSLSQCCSPGLVL